MKMRIGRTKVLFFENDVVYKVYYGGYGRWTSQMLFENYSRILDWVKGLDGFEQLIEASYPVLKVKYAGELVKDDNISSVISPGPQITQILETLESLNIKHRDVIPGNLLVKDSKLTLVDYEYSFFPGCIFIDEEEAPYGLAGPFKSEKGFDDSFSFHEIWRGFGRELVLKKDITKKISLIASEGYKDGSSVWQGVTFHPIPFDDFSSVRSHKKIPCHAEYTAIKNFIEEKKIEKDSVLDLGSNVGFFSFSFNRDFDSTVLGIEKDAFNEQVARLLALFYEKRRVTFEIGDALEYVLATDKVFDIVLCLNTHMWMYKQHTAEKTMQMMKKLAKMTRHLFFQTAHAESASMYTVNELKNKEELINYLKEAGFENIEPIFESNLHDRKLRILFYAEGDKRN